MHSHSGGEPLRGPLVHMVDVAFRARGFECVLVLGADLRFRRLPPQAAQVHDMGRPKTWLPGTSGQFSSIFDIFFFLSFCGTSEKILVPL